MFLPSDKHTNACACYLSSVILFALVSLIAMLFPTGRWAYRQVAIIRLIALCLCNTKEIMLLIWMAAHYKHSSFAAMKVMSFPAAANCAFSVTDPDSTFHRPPVRWYLLKSVCNTNPLEKSSRMQISNFATGCPLS